MDHSRWNPRTCSGTSWPAVPRPLLAAQASSLDTERTSIVFLEMDDQRAEITGEPEAIPLPGPGQESLCAAPARTIALAAQRRPRGQEAGRGGWGGAVVLGTGLVGLMCAVAAAAQEPSSPPPPAGGRGHEGARHHELLPDIGRIGAQVGVGAGPSWNPYRVGAGGQVTAFIDLPLARNRAGRLSYEMLLGLSGGKSDTFTLTDPLAYVAKLARGADPPGAPARPPPPPDPGRPLGGAAPGPPGLPP